MRAYLAVVIIVDIAAALVITFAYAQEQRHPTAVELNQQLLESEVRNYRQAVAQLSEQNQKLQDQLTDAQKKCEK